MKRKVDNRLIQTFYRCTNSAFFENHEQLFVFRCLPYLNYAQKQTMSHSEVSFHFHY